jgi:hypothetical protein
MAAKVGMSGLQPGSIGVVGGVPQIGAPPPGPPAALGSATPSHALPAPPSGGGGGGGGGEDPLVLQRHFLG